MTQDGSVEVMWDWHSPVRKPTNGMNKKTFDPCLTPKRSATMRHKKRMSNSPLLYEPTKRKLINNDKNSGNVAEFKALMESVTEQIKNAQKDEKVNEENIPEQIDFDFSDNESDLVINTSDKPTIINKIEDKSKSSIDDLFDVSGSDEAMMIRCSQEIEEKLNIATDIKQKSNNINTNNNKVLKNNTTTVFSVNKSQNTNKHNTIVQNKNYIAKNSLMNLNKQSTIKSNINQPLISKPNNTQRSMVTKYKSEPITPKSAKKSIIFSNTNPGAETTINGKNLVNLDEYENFNIPDDSFDDFVASCKPESLEKNDQTNLNVQSTNSSRNVKIKTPTRTTSMCLSKAIPQSSNNRGNNVNKANTFVKTTGTTTTTVPNIDNRNWKFFKSKSHSDSSTGINEGNNTPGGSKMSINKNSRTVAGSSVSTQNPSIHRTTSSVDSNTLKGKSISTNPKPNPIPMSHVNRSGKNENGDKIKSQSTIIASGMQSLQLRTAEEIERRRLEAKRKLEAKKRRLLSINKSKSDLGMFKGSTKR